ncbi:MAG: growth/differentiation factor [Coriobacteriia bacterium]|nr:growth/differentiation factor [Coriobacteriia bacterium]
MDISNLINTLAYVASDVDESALLPLVLLLSGFIFYGYMYTRYRNADKRHKDEMETTTIVANLVSTDTYFKSRKGLKNATMAGSNHKRVEGALNVGSGNKLLDMVK